MTYPKRLIELSIPLDAILAQSAREKSIHHGLISTPHIWWARRPLADAPDDPTERKPPGKLISTIVDWDLALTKSFCARSTRNSKADSARPDRSGGGGVSRENLVA